MTESIVERLMREEIERMHVRLSASEKAEREARQKIERLRSIIEALVQELSDTIEDNKKAAPP